MKRSIALSLACLLLALFLVSCGNDLTVEKHEWVLQYAMAEAYSDDPVAVSPERAAENPDASVVDVYLSARRGKLTVTDATSGATYEGTYEKTGENEQGEEKYTVTLGDTVGVAEVVLVTYKGGAQGPSLKIAVGDYQMRFYPQED